MADMIKADGEIREFTRGFAHDITISNSGSLRACKMLSEIKPLQTHVESTPAGGFLNPNLDSSDPFMNRELEEAGLESMPTNMPIEVPVAEKTK